MIWILKWLCMTMRKPIGLCEDIRYKSSGPAPRLSCDRPGTAASPKCCNSWKGAANVAHGEEEPRVSTEKGVTVSATDFIDIIEKVAWRKEFLYIKRIYIYLYIVCTDSANTICLISFYIYIIFNPFPLDCFLKTKSVRSGGIVKILKVENQTSSHDAKLWKWRVTV